MQEEEGESRNSAGERPAEERGAVMERCLGPGVGSQMRTEVRMFEWESGWGHK